QVYDATNIRLREVSLGYRLPIKWEGIQQASVAVTGRNLFFFKNNAPYDPELNTTTGVGGQGLDIFGLPTTRQYGLTLKVSFYIAKHNEKIHKNQGLQMAPGRHGRRRA